MKDRIKKYIKVIFGILGYQISSIPGILITQTQASKNEQDVFNALYGQIRECSLLTKDRMFMLYQLVKYASNLDGDMAEVGVAMGGTAKLISKTALNKNIYLFDTFSGMPPMCTEIDLYAEDFSDISFDSARSFLSDCPNITFCKGIFPETAEIVKSKKFSLVHIDVDIYRSVKGCLDFFYSRMVKKGIIVIDDYGFWGCPGVKKAVSEFFFDKNERPIITTKIQCAVIKL